MAQFKDFIEAGSSHGIRPIRYKVNSLEQLVKGDASLSAPDKPGYEIDNDPDSISDFLAHLIHFAKLLESKDPSTVAEWRGMLCEIFYSGLVSGGVIEVDRWTDLTNKSILAKLFFERFNTNNKHTGYGYETDGKPILNEFCRFKKNGVPFAMLVPGIVILPLRKFDRTIFNASEWYNRDIGKWDNRKIIEFFRSKNNAEIEMFVSFLLGVQEKCGTAKQAVQDFVEDIIGDADWPEATENKGDLLEALNNGYAARQEKNGVRGYSGNYFNEKLFCFKSYFSGRIENESIPDEHTNAWDCYKIDNGGKLLTPIKLSSFCRDDAPVYVVPPFNNEFLGAVKSGAVTNVSWSAAIPETSFEASEIKVWVTFEFNGESHTVPAEYGLEKIVVADDLPYISMWPYAVAVEGAPEWKEYFIGIGGVNENSQVRLDRSEYRGIDFKANQNTIKKLRFEDIKISVCADMSRYSVRTLPFGLDDRRSNFTMIKTEEFPEFLQLTSTDGTALGCWQLDRSRAVRLGSVAGTDGIIGFDFATTATVEALSINGRTSFIEGPGAYLYDVFNPFYNTNMENGEPEFKRLWKMVQNYYFFGHNDSKCKKIFSYGQVNTAKDERGQEIVTTTNYVTGRPVFVTDEYLFRNIQRKADNIIDNSAIKTPVKWPETDVGSKSKDTNATNNFVLGCLTWGLLAARRRGCQKVNINLSLPLGRKSDTISVVMHTLAPTLKAISGYGDSLTYQIFSEAGANAKYLFDGSNKIDSNNQRWHGNTVPNPENGFMLVDLGGGTTDICVCQYNDPSLSFDEKIKCETSFKYAGRELVDLSLLKNPKFKTMWIEKEGDVVGEYIVKQLIGGDRATEAQKKEPLFKIDDNLDPIMDKGQGNLNQAIAFVSYILDNLRLTESAAQNTDGALDDIKHKYLAFFWVLGRYLRHIRDEGIVQIDITKIFKIYLTGCASKGIKTFCEPSDQDFIKKCRNAAYYGFYFGDKKEDISPKNFINIEVISGDEKKEVAYGLTAFDTVKDAMQSDSDDDIVAPLDDDDVLFNVFGNEDEGEAIASEEVVDGTVVISAEKATLLDIDGVLDEKGKNRCRRYLKAIFSVVAALMNDKELLYDAILEKHIREGGENWIESYVDNIEQRTPISPYISDKFIYEELLALFCYEKYCDLKNAEHRGGDVG